MFFAEKLKLKGRGRNGRLKIVEPPDSKIPPEAVFCSGRDFGDAADPENRACGMRGENYFSMLVRTTSFLSHTGEWCSAASQLMSPVPMRQMPRKCDIDSRASGM